MERPRRPDRVRKSRQTVARTWQSPALVAGDCRESPVIARGRSPRRLVAGALLLRGARILRGTGILRCARVLGGTWILGGAGLLRRARVLCRTRVLRGTGVLGSARVGGLGRAGILRGARVRLLGEGGAGGTQAEDTSDHDRRGFRSHHSCHLLSLAAAPLNPPATGFIPGKAAESDVTAAMVVGASGAIARPGIYRAIPWLPWMRKQ